MTDARLQQTDLFRDFGILPEATGSPPAHVRSFLSRGRVIGQYIGTALVVALGLGLAGLLTWTLPLPLNVLGCVAVLAGFASFLYLATHNDYRWVELDGKMLRAKHLYTGRVIERSVEEIESLATILYPIRRRETVIFEGLFGRVKGVEVRFRDRRTPLRILRADPAMTNAKELIEAIVSKMAQIREIGAEIVDWVGKPLVRQIHWKGEIPAVHTSKKTRKLLVMATVGLALVFGVILGFWGLQEQTRYLLSSVPPQELTLQSLIQNGPGSNPHVALTEFVFAGYFVETSRGTWSNVWIALFPDPPKRRFNEISAILRCENIRNQDALDEFLWQKRVIVLCPNGRQSTLGTVRAKLIEANPGSDLSSAWVIEEMSDPPSEAKVQGLFLGSGACYALVNALAVIVLFKTS